NPAWTTQLDQGNTVEIKDGALELRAHSPNSRAYIERKLGVDLFRVTCALEATSAEGVASLVIFWDANDYIQVGLTRSGSGRFAARERLQGMLSSFPVECDLGPWSPEWNAAAVELGRDCICFS